MLIILVSKASTHTQIHLIPK